MSSCCSKKKKKNEPECPITYFGSQVDNSWEYADAWKKKGGKVVGIMCEYTPREIIMAAGGAPVCLCGGSNEMVGPAEKVLPSNLCPIIKSTFGYSLEKENPFLEMADLVIAETTCDGKKKMYELLAERHPMHVLELPQKQNDKDALKYWEAELRKLILVLEKKFKTKITDKKLRAAIKTMNRERQLKRGLASLMKELKPPLTGRELLDMKSLVAAMPEDFKQYENAMSMLPGRDIVPSAKDRVRVLLTGVPLPHGAERVMDIIEDNGGLVVCQENCTGLKPVLEDVDENAKDPVKAIAAKYFHLPCSVMTKNTAREESIKTLAADYKAECVIEVVWQACITYDVESSLIKRHSEESLGLPYLRIETDYSPSDTDRIALRVQSLFETVKGRPGKKGKKDVLRGN